MKLRWPWMKKKEAEEVWVDIAPTLNQFILQAYEEGVDVTKKKSAKGKGKKIAKYLSKPKPTGKPSSVSRKVSRSKRSSSR